MGWTLALLTTRAPRTHHPAWYLVGSQTPAGWWLINWHLQSMGFSWQRWRQHSQRPQDSEIQQEGHWSWTFSGTYMYTLLANPCGSPDPRALKIQGVGGATLGTPRRGTPRLAWRLRWESWRGLPATWQFYGSSNLSSGHETISVTQTRGRFLLSSDL